MILKSIINKKSFLLKTTTISCLSTEISSTLKEPMKQIRPSSLRQAEAGRLFEGKTITIFGASGVLGQALIRELYKYGPLLITPHRGDPTDCKDLKLFGDMGQVLFMPFHIDNESSIYKAIRNSSIVINCLGQFYDCNRFPIEHVNVNAARNIAKMCTNLGVEKLIHLSALNCTETPTPYMLSKGSQFLKTKALGEKEVLNEFPKAIIIRPSYICGQRDHFLFYYLQRYRFHRFGKSLYYPLWEKGEKTVKQPVYVNDVARGILNIIADPNCHSRIYQAVGPHRYRLDTLVAWIFMHIRFNTSNFQIIDNTNFLRLKARFFETFYPWFPKISQEMLEYECHSDIIDHNLPNLTDLDVKLTQLEDILAWELKPMRRFGFYWDPQGEFPEPPHPPLACE